MAFNKTGLTNEASGFISAQDTAGSDMEIPKVILLYDLHTMYHKEKDRLSGRPFSL